MSLKIGDKVRYIGDTYDFCKGLIGVIKAEGSLNGECVVDFGKEFFGHSATTTDYDDKEYHSWFVFYRELEKVND